MKRGEIIYANLNPTVGSEMAKRRPVLIVSNDVNNRAASTVTILPITSNVSRVNPGSFYQTSEHLILIHPVRFSLFEG